MSEEHPDLFEQAVAYEDKVTFEATAMKDRRYTWSPGESLRDLVARKDEIVAKHEASLAREKKQKPNRPLVEALGEVLDEEDDAMGCQICHL